MAIDLRLAYIGSFMHFWLRPFYLSDTMPHSYTVVYVRPKIRQAFSAHFKGSYIVLS